MGTSVHYSVAECAANSDGVANILGLYARATAHQHEQGMGWYPLARVEAEAIAARYNLPVKTVVMVACALSPRMRWENNMAAAEAAIRYWLSGQFIPSISNYKAAGGTCLLARVKGTPAETVVLSEDARFTPDLSTGALRGNMLKACWILQGHVWVLRGKKVNSFLSNILEWETSQLVTVDSHAIQVWFGILEPGTYAVPPTWYALIAADYIKAAAVVGIAPLQMQAVTWLVKKSLSSRRKASK